MRAATLTPSPEDVAAIDDDVADIDADTEFDAFVQRHVDVAAGHTLLDVDRAAHRVDGAAKLGQDTVPGVLDDSSAVLRDLWI
jgi:hypothetical protein